MSLTSLIPAGSEYCVLRADAVDRLLSCGDADGALLYLYLIRRGSDFREEDAMRDLHFSPERMERAVFTLTNLQIASAPRDLRPEKSTGSSIAVGVSLPVLPTSQLTSSTLVVSSSASNLYAIAQRGNFCV